MNQPTTQHRSRVLDEFAARQAASRASIKAAGENSVTSDLSLEQLLGVLGIAGATSSGMPVTAETAMRETTVYACVGLIAGAVASMPLGIFERDGNDRRKADHEYWWLFNEKANEDMTSYVAWEYLLTSKFFEGDGFAELLRPSSVSSRVIGWRPWHPRRVEPFVGPDKQLLYRVSPANGASYVLDSADMIHITSLGFDGLRSPSPITYAARQAIGTALAGETYTGKFFSEGGTFDYALKTSKSLDEKQIAALKTSLLARLSSGPNSRVPLILTGDLAPAQLSVNPKDAEILGSRLFSARQICQILGVPPDMVGLEDKSTSWGSGVEQRGLAFVRYTLQRHLTAIAQELNRKLWPTRAKFFAEHITAALERGDIKSRYESYRIALGRAGEQPFMNVDEIRRIENLPPGAVLPTNQGASNAQPPAAAAG